MRTITRNPSSGEQAARQTLPRRFALEATGLAKVVAAGDTQKVVLNDVDINIRKSQFTVIKGESGSGKTSLLHCLAGLDQPTNGKIVSGDVDITQLTRGQQVDWRGNNMGYVGQKADLLAGPVINSILDPHLIAEHDIDPEWALEVFTTLGIGSREFLGRSTSKLSGGEQQRVAIARALVQRPDILFADEPTSALDSERTAEVHSLLRSMVDEHGVTVVMVSHDPLSEMYAHNVEVMQDGNITT